MPMNFQLICPISDHVRIIELLIKNGANVNLGENRLRSALHWAAIKGIRLIALVKTN